jgi:mono/diheme cytochrome c family protein
MPLIAGRKRVRNWSERLKAKENKAMTEEKTERHVMLASIFLLLLFVVLTLSVTSIVRANPGPDRAAGNATFRTKSAMCHGQDGSCSEVGKSVNVPDLGSPAVQKLPEVQLAQIISDGKGGMPSFAQRGLDSFPAGAYSLAASKEIARTLSAAVVTDRKGFQSFGREAL